MQALSRRFTLLRWLLLWVLLGPWLALAAEPSLPGDEAGKAYYGVRQDLDTLGTIIRLILARLDRVASPVFLAGESYGGFRAAKLPARLAKEQGISVSGTVMISPVLEFSLMRGDEF